MSLLLKIGIIASIFIILNILLVNFERVAFKIRDNNYTHYLLGQQSIATCPRRSNGKLKVQGVNQLGGGMDELQTKLSSWFLGNQRPGFEEVQKTISTWLLDIKGRVIELLEKYLSKETSDKLWLVIVADAVDLLTNSQNSITSFINKVRSEDDGTVERIVNNVNKLVENPEFAVLKEEFNKLLGNKDIVKIRDELTSKIKTTVLQQLVNKITEIEKTNLKTFQNNVDTNIKRELQGKKISNQLEQLNLILALHSNGLIEYEREGVDYFREPNDII